jgi:hypothetical protein
MLPRIVELLNSNNFQITTRWSTNEIRCIDFVRLLSDYPQTLKDKILTEEIFSTISLNKESKTIYFPNLVPYKDENGNNAFCELDFCPDVLFASSFLLPQIPSWP